MIIADRGIDRNFRYAGEKAVPGKALQRFAFERPCVYPRKKFIVGQNRSLTWIFSTSLPRGIMGKAARRASTRWCSSNPLQPCRSGCTHQRKAGQGEEAELLLPAECRYGASRISGHTMPMARTNSSCPISCGIKQANKCMNLSGIAYNLKKYLKFVEKRSKSGVGCLVWQHC